MKLKTGIFLLLLLPSFLFSLPMELRHVVTIQGLQDNPVLGYGIIIGLKGTGDSENGSQTKEILSRIANNFGFTLSPDRIKPKNCAVVLVSATLTPFLQNGSRLDVKVASVFDAKSLEGGELVLTPMLGGDSEIYAIAQGSVITERSAKGVNGTIPQGAIIQKTVDQNLMASNGILTLGVRDNLGISALTRMVQLLRAKYPDQIVGVENQSVRIKVPGGQDTFAFLDELYKLKIDIEDEPSILIDSKTGILISGGNVVLSSAAISWNGMKVNIGSQAMPRSAGFGNAGQAQNGGVKMIPASTTVQELVDALNQVGASGKDIAKILELLYKNGNLKARVILQ